MAGLGDGEEARSGRDWRIFAASGAVAAIAAILWLLAAGTLSGEGARAERVQPAASPATMDGESAEKVARRIAAVHADITAVWRHELRWHQGRAYAPPEIVNFVGRRDSPCAGSAGVSGLAYCASDRTLSLDLAFMGGLQESLGAAGGRGLALLVARGLAEHLQAELAILGDAERARRGLAPEAAAALDLEIALQGDCLAAVWARRAEGRLGGVEEGLWSLLVVEVRDNSSATAAAAHLDAGEPVLREEAFARGYMSGDLRDCLVPGLSGVLD